MLKDQNQQEEILNLQINSFNLSMLKFSKKNLALYIYL